MKIAVNNLNGSYNQNLNNNYKTSFCMRIPNDTREVVVNSYCKSLNGILKPIILDEVLTPEQKLQGIEILNRALDNLNKVFEKISEQNDGLLLDIKNPGDYYNKTLVTKIYKPWAKHGLEFTTSNDFLELSSTLIKTLKDENLTQKVAIAADETKQKLLQEEAERYKERREIYEENRLLMEGEALCNDLLLKNNKPLPPLQKEKSFIDKIAEFFFEK